MLPPTRYPDLGITCAMVGKWKDAPAGGCLDSVCDDAGASLVRAQEGLRSYGHFSPGQSRCVVCYWCSWGLSNREKDAFSSESDILHW